MDVVVIDTSAIVAVLFGEDDARRFVDAIDAAPVRLISAVTRVELSIVIEGRKREAGRNQLDRLLALIGAQIIAVTAEHAALAIGAFRSFGKGRHPAGLNIGDCFPYALASATNSSLLFKGNDFSMTDIRPALS